MQFPLMRKEKNMVHLNDRVDNCVSLRYMGNPGQKTGSEGGL